MRMRIDLVVLTLLGAFLVAGCGDDENPLQANETFTGRWVTDTGIGITFTWEFVETEAGVDGNLYQTLSTEERGPMPLKHATRDGDTIRFSIVDDEAVLLLGGGLVALDSFYAKATLETSSLLIMQGTFCFSDTCVSELFPAFRRQVGF